MVPRSSDRISRVPPYLIRQISLRIRGCHPYCPAFQLVLLTIIARLVRVRSPLLTEYLLMSFPPGTEMFQFPGFAFLTLYIQVKNTWFTKLSIGLRQTITQYQVGCPIRRSMTQSLLPTHHGLSQVITSFIASYCLGIHQTPFSRLIRSRRLVTGPDIQSANTSNINSFANLPIESHLTAPVLVLEKGTDASVSNSRRIRHIELHATYVT